ncbi:hypothetical protein CRE_02785 [Caenorhabditis remanei]|uniref:Ig-like domain-containing protein n=1 Tax=Caenorhabditis remanei TaxID=31234 RepID=E3NVA3_CAERE|nr:hypothetical protein CRE_02785 [Caenorhabditis remanei]
MRFRFLLLLCTTSVLWSVASTQLVLGKPPIFQDGGSVEQKVAVEGEYFNYFNSSFVSFPGEIIRLKCEDAELAEQYEWRVNDASGELIATTRFAEVTVSRANDNQKYRCVARNTVGAAISPPSMVRSKCKSFCFFLIISAFLSLVS